MTWQIGTSCLASLWSKVNLTYLFEIYTLLADWEGVVMPKSAFSNVFFSKDFAAFISSCGLNVAKWFLGRKLFMEVMEFQFRKFYRGRVMKIEENVLKS